MNQEKLFYNDMSKKTDKKTCSAAHPKIKGESYCRVCKKARDEEE